MSFATGERRRAVKPGERLGPAGRPAAREDASPVNPAWQLLSLRAGPVQPKLKVGPADDPHEREADRVAEQVLGMPEPPAAEHAPALAPLAAHHVQRKCAGCACAECEEDETQAPLRRKQSGAGAHPADVAPLVHDALGSVGQPLDAATRAYFEPRFGQDLGAVRVHTGGAAAHAASALRALAFTRSDRIAFASGQYAPHSPAGRRLLAHELAHTLQQARDPRLGIQRSSAVPGSGGGSPAGPSNRAGGCAWDDSDEVVKEAGTLAHAQVQRQVRADQPSVRSEVWVPRANKGATREFVSVPCQPAEQTQGRVDLCFFARPAFQFAEIKPSTGVAEGREDYAHYALRLEELKSRYLDGPLCDGARSSGTVDLNFDADYLGSYLWNSYSKGERYATNAFTAQPLPASLVPSADRDAGRFDGPGPDDLHLYYKNRVDGVVTYACRRNRRAEDKGEGETEVPGEAPALTPQRTSPLLRGSDPLLAGWLAALQTRPVPAGEGYAVAVSAPVYNALKFAAAGRLPYSRATLSIEGGAELVALALGAVGLGLMAGGALPPVGTTATAATPVGQAGTLAAAEAHAAAQATRTAAAELGQRAAAAQAARSAGQGVASGVALVAPPSAEPESATLPPGEARSESALGRLATRFTPVLANVFDLWPALYFAETGAPLEDGVPLPFADAAAPDALGRLAWDAVSALVPYSGLTDIPSLRELGLLKNAVLYANPALIAVFAGGPAELPEVGTLRDVAGFQYVVIANYAGRP